MLLHAILRMCLLVIHLQMIPPAAQERKERGDKQEPASHRKEEGSGTPDTNKQR